MIRTAALALILPCFPLAQSCGKSSSASTKEGDIAAVDPMTREHYEAQAAAFIDQDIGPVVKAVTEAEPGAQDALIDKLKDVYSEDAPVFAEFGNPTTGAAGAVGLFFGIKAQTGHGLYVHRVCGHYAVKKGDGAHVYFPNIAIGALPTSATDQTPIGLLVEILNEYLEIGPSGATPRVIRHGVDPSAGFQAVKAFPWTEAESSPAAKRAFFEERIQEIASYECGATGNIEADAWFGRLLESDEAEAAGSWAAPTE